MSAVGDIRYSDVACYVGLSLHAANKERDLSVRTRRPAPPKVATRSLSCSRLGGSPAASPSSSKLVPRGQELPPILAAHVDKVKSQLSLLQAEHYVHQEAARRIHMSLSESLLQEKKVKERVSRQKDVHHHHKQKCEAMDREIARLRSEMDSLQKGTFPHSPSTAAPSPSPPESAMASLELESNRPAVALDVHDTMDGAVPAHGPPKKAFGRPRRKAAASRAAQPLASTTADEAAASSVEDAGGSALCSGTLGASNDDEDSDLDSLWSHLDDVFSCPAPAPVADGKDDPHPVAAEPLKDTAPPAEGAAPHALAARGSESAVLGAAEPVQQEDELVTFLREAGKDIKKMTKSELAELAEVRRSVVRSALLEKMHGDARAAFRFIDLNNSGCISTQEWLDGTRRLGLDYTKLVGLTRDRDFFNLFDYDHDHVIMFPELFPEAHARERSGQVRVSTPEFCKRYRREKEQAMRPPEWNPNAEEKMNHVFGIADRNAESASRRKWMQATLRRLKGRGKSDARCRELVALHLPRGTGAPDRQGVPTVSKVDIKKIRQGYMDQLNGPIRETTKTMSDMRDLRREQKQIIDKLFKVTEAEQMRDLAGASLGSGLKGMFGNKSTQDLTATAPASSAATPEKAAEKKPEHDLAAIAKAGNIEKESLERLLLQYNKHAEKGELRHPQFAKLVKVLAPNRTFANADISMWWKRILKAEERKPAPSDASEAASGAKEKTKNLRMSMVAAMEDGAGLLQNIEAQAMKVSQATCEFPQFALWYASSEVRS